MASGTGRQAWGGRLRVVGTGRQAWGIRHGASGTGHQAQAWGGRLRHGASAMGRQSGNGTSGMNWGV